MKTTYSYTILKYVHDIVTGEHINVGVVIYAPEANFLQMKCTSRYGRISKVFSDFDGHKFCSLLRFIKSRFDKLNDDNQQGELWVKNCRSVMDFAKIVLPEDDSSLQWSEVRGGISNDIEKTLEQLYLRLVARYEKTSDTPTRNDEDIWRLFRSNFKDNVALQYLIPKCIVGADYKYEFEHAWKNGLWNLYEPVSLDLQRAENIENKANRWVGRAMNLKDSKDDFKLFMLLGKPSLERLKPVYEKACNMLNKMPVEKEFITEDEAEEFASQLAKKIQAKANDLE